jgi:hypothetical protein
MVAMDCACGHHLESTDEEGLYCEARKHVDVKHSDLGLSESQLRALVREKMYRMHTAQT